MLTGRNEAQLILSPLESERVLSSNDEKLFDFEDLQRRGVVLVRPDSAPPWYVEVLKVVPGFAMMAVIVGVFVDNLWADYWLWIGGGGAAAVMVLILLSARGHEGLWRSTVQIFTGLAVAGVAVVVPALIIYFFGEGDRLFDRETRGVVQLGRALQWLFIATASMLPALLYYFFDRQQLSTLRRQLEHDIFRLDPSAHNLNDIRSRYGKQLDEAFGDTHSKTRLRAGKRWPILIATIIITLGWILTLTPVGPHQDLLTTPAASGGASLGVDGQGPTESLLSFFVPRLEPLVLAFLGAYFFTLQTAILRFVRRDLKPSAYASVSVRILMAVILSWVLTLVGVGDIAAGLVAFVVGIFPETGVALILETLRKPAGIMQIVVPKNYAEAHPLTDLEGIGLYDRARLEDEGVTNVQSLAHHDLVDLMIETRIPASRLVDWVDQAVLSLHLRRARPTAETPSPWEKRFHGLGIRNVTDLLKTADSHGVVLVADQDDERQTSELAAFIDSIRDDEWVANLRHWRCPKNMDDEPHDIPKKSPTDVVIPLAGPAAAILADAAEPTTPPAASAATPSPDASGTADE